MVVPPPTGIDLLREHAYYEYGSKDLASLFSFDYDFASQDSVGGSEKNLFQDLVAILAVIVACVSLFSYVDKHLQLSRRTNQQRRSYGAGLQGHDYEHKHDDYDTDYDIEANIPALSHSETPTPNNSPELSRFGVNLYRFEDHQHSFKSH